MADKLKVTFTTINIRNNGEWTGKGEIYYELLVDDFQVDSIPKENPRKVADGETIVVNLFHSVTKQPGQTLSVESSVSEKDNLDKDEFATKKNQFTEAENWGIGTHNVNLRDGNLDVIVNYKIERQ